MRKILLVMIAVLMFFSLTGCGSKEDKAIEEATEIVNQFNSSFIYTGGGINYISGTGTNKEAFSVLIYFEEDKDPSSDDDEIDFYNAMSRGETLYEKLSPLFEDLDMPIYISITSSDGKTIYYTTDDGVNWY